MKQNYFTTNNFDLLRVFAAFQVAIHHLAAHLKIEHLPGIFQGLLDASRALPGVPIFFFISGFLISKSYENNSKIFEYAQNRILRIYPGLTVCLGLSVGSVFLLGYFRQNEVGFNQFAAWILAQLSVAQFYNPDFMRGYGVGVLNGSLWTIAVEVQFYVLTPLLYSSLKLLGQSKLREQNTFLICLVLIFMVANRIFVSYRFIYQENFIYKLLGATFIPYFYMYLIGVIFQKNYNLLSRYLEGKFLMIFLLYWPSALMLNQTFGLPLGNSISPFLYLPLSVVIFAGAFTSKSLSSKLLKKQDISYGIYIYHMPVVNGIIYLGWLGELKALSLAIFITLILAIISWLFVEKRFLKLKKNPLNPLRFSN
jgi:peptidoglycan/LPS O-acetylase OafA/YrhL